MDKKVCPKMKNEKNFWNKNFHTTMLKICCLFEQRKKSKANNVINNIIFAYNYDVFINNCGFALSSLFFLATQNI